MLDTQTAMSGEGMCPGPCQSRIPAQQICCASCVLLLPVDLVVLADHARDLPDLYATVADCVEAWFRVKHQDIPPSLAG